jgi:hypothetical protein
MGIAVFWSLIPHAIEFDLFLGRDCLIGRKRINREETCAMTRQAIQSDHADPCIHAIENRGGDPPSEPTPERPNFGFRFWVEEHGEIQVSFLIGSLWDDGQAG